MTSDPLAVLRAEISARAEVIASSTPGWPCGKGCDGCCRNLACLPELVQAEWREVEEGLAALPAETRAEIEERLRDLGHGARPPHVCPFLDRENGACHIYSHRPVACRTYGFYVERGVGSYCGIIRERVERGEYSGVVWGKHESVDARLDRMGPKTPMLDWIQRRCAMR